MKEPISYVRDVIRSADILLMVIDARRIEESIHPELVNIIYRNRKKLLYVINKVDLVPRGTKLLDLPDSVQVSAQKHVGTMRLQRKIMELSEGKNAVVGVIGYPNTGKSTLINALKGRHATRTSSVAGFTKHMQKVRISKHLILLDTPGVLPYRRNASRDMISIGAVNPEQLKDRIGAAMQLIADYHGAVEKKFGVPVSEDLEATIGAIALKMHVIKKGGLPDTERMSTQIIRLCQQGEIRASKGT